MTEHQWWTKVRRRRERERAEPVGAVSGMNYNAAIRRFAEMEDDERKPPSEIELKRRQRETIAESVDEISEWLETVDISDLRLVDALRIWAAASSIQAWVSYQAMKYGLTPSAEMQSSDLDAIDPSTGECRFDQLEERATSVMSYCGFSLGGPPRLAETGKGRLATIIELWKRRDLVKSLALSSGLQAWASFDALENTHPLGESDYVRKWWANDKSDNQHGHREDG